MGKPSLASCSAIGTTRGASCVGPNVGSSWPDWNATSPVTRNGSETADRGLSQARPPSLPTRPNVFANQSHERALRPVANTSFDDALQILLSPNRNLRAALADV